MVNRIGGLASGMDIDEIVKKLMKAERAPLNKLNQKKTTYEWQRDAYRSVNTKLRTFDTYIADNFILKSLTSKTATSSNSSLVSATATGKATGTLSIDGVSQLATAARMTGDQINAVGSTKMSDFGAVGTIEFKAIQSNGQLASEATKIEITADMTVDQFITKVNNSNAGISAVFENGRFSFTAKNTGDVKSEDEIQIVNGKNIFDKLGFVNPNKVQKTEGTNARFSVNGIATERSTNTFSLNGYSVTLKSIFNETATHNQFSSTSNTTLVNATSNLENLLLDLSTNYGETLDQNDSLGDQTNTLKAVLDAKITNLQKDVNDAKNNLKGARDYLFYNDNIKNLSTKAKTFVSSLTSEQRTTLADADLVTYDISQLNLTPEQQANYDALAVDDKTALTNLEKEDFNKTAGSVYDSLSAKAKELLPTFTVGTDLDSNTDITPEDKAILTSLNETDLAAIKSVYNKNKDVNDATTELNKVNTDATKLVNTVDAYNAAQNTANTIGAAPTTTVTSEAVTMTSTTNVDDMMTKIKEFVTTYNGLIKDLTDQTKQSKYRDYSPLTAEQKEDMSENEIKLWEEKAKSGLLRNDALIREGLSNMRSLIYQSNPAIDSKYNTLFSIGITTSKNYNDGGTLEIDEVKLRKVLEEDPDAVEKLFKNSEGKEKDLVQVEENGKTVTKEVDTRGFLYSLRSSMKSFEISIEKKAGRSTMTDAQYAIGKSLMDTESRISTWKRKLENIESRYWKQFTAMEKAINKANQQSSMFMQGQ